MLRRSDLNVLPQTLASVIPSPEGSASPESINPGQWSWIPGSPGSLSSGRPKAGPVGGASK